MLLQIKEAVRSSFLRNNAILFVGSMVAAGLNYLYYPVLSRMMGVADFGEVQVLVSLILQAAIFLSVINIVITNVVANDKSSDKKVAHQLLAEIEKLMLLLAIGSSLLLLLLVPSIRSYLHFSSSVPIVMSIVTLFITAPLALRNAYLNGRKQFGFVSVGNAGSSAVKLALAVLFVYFGLRSGGAITGFAISQIFALIYVGWHAKKMGYRLKLSRAIKKPDFKLLRPQLRYGVFVMIITLIVNLQISLDVIVVKRFFSPEAAGLYAGLTVISRIIYYLTTSFALVLLSSVQMTDRSGNNRRLLIRSSALLLAVGGLAMIVFSLWPSFTLQLLVGVKYISLSPLLPKLSLAIFIVSVVNLLLTYCLALRLYRVLIPAVTGALSTYLLFIFHHDSLSYVIDSLLIGTLLMAGLVGGWALLQLRAQNSKGSTA